MVDENDDKKVEWKEILDHYNITAEALQSLRKKRGRTEDEEKQVKVKLANLREQSYAMNCDAIFMAVK